MLKKLFGWVVVCATAIEYILNRIGQWDTAVSVFNDFSKIQTQLSSSNLTLFEGFLFTLFVVGVLILIDSYFPNFFKPFNFSFIGDIKEKIGVKKIEAQITKDERIPFISLYRIARLYDIHVVTGEHSMLKLSNAMRQAAVDDKLTFYGRNNKNILPAQNLKEPLLKIAPSHWHKYDLEWIVGDVYNFVNNPDGAIYDNFPFKSIDYEKTTQDGNYVDLHLDSKQAIMWLKTLDPKDFKQNV